MNFPSQEETNVVLNYFSREDKQLLSVVRRVGSISPASLLQVYARKGVGPVI